MVDPTSGPFLFDTSAESWLGRAERSEVLDWMREYLAHHEIHISAVTVMERVRGYSLLWRRAEEAGRARTETARVAYLTKLGRVWPLDGAVAVVAGEIMALLPEPPTPPRRSHQLAESRQEPGPLAVRRNDRRYSARREDAAHSQQRRRLRVRSERHRTLSRAIPQPGPQGAPLELIRCASLA